MNAAKPVIPVVSMLNVDISPVPTVSSKQEPSGAIGVIVPPSWTTTHESPSIKSSTPPSSVCMVASIGASVGIITTFIDGSA